MHIAKALEPEELIRAIAGLRQNKRFVGAIHELPLREFVVSGIFCVSPDWFIYSNFPLSQNLSLKVDPH
ncbi:hypothetical protein [Scytonema sp. PCC 10023]|uniref:hypothetical protein n=1 Tax=Scytonema sp. PCC 10023 TaxID=1680591 RepID=UPI0039C61536